MLNNCKTFRKRNRW